MKRENSPYYIKHRPSHGDYGVYSVDGDELLRTGPHMRDVKNIMANMEANLPNTEKGFGSWGIPNFMKATG